MTAVAEQDGALLMKVFVQPRASKNSVAGHHGDAVKIRLTAPPVDGAANKMCLKFLSKWLGVPKSRIAIVSGETSRNKMVRIQFDTVENAAVERKRVKGLIAGI